MPRHTRLLACFAPACAIALALTGCAKQHHGRVDPYETTYPETRSDRILPVALLEFSDQVPQRLIADLRQLPEMTGREIEGPATVILGDLRNETGVVPTSEFEAMAQRIRNQLVNAQAVRSELRFVEERARVERIAARERIVTTPSDQPAGVRGRFDTGDYDADSTFILIGDFFRSHRGSTNQYYMQFRLIDAATNTIVFSDDYDVKQMN